jgi:hypothetical protein
LPHGGFGSRSPVRSTGPVPKRLPERSGHGSAAAGPTSGACSRASHCAIPAHATYHGRTVPLGSCAGFFGVSPTSHISLNVGESVKITGSFRETTPRQLPPPLTSPLLAPNRLSVRCRSW